MKSFVEDHILTIPISLGVETTEEYPTFKNLFRTVIQSSESRRKQPSAEKQKQNNKQALFQISEAGLGSSFFLKKRE